MILLQATVMALLAEQKGLRLSPLSERIRAEILGVERGR